MTINSGIPVRIQVLLWGHLEWDGEPKSSPFHFFMCEVWSFKMDKPGLLSPLLILILILRVFAIFAFLEQLWVPSWFILGFAGLQAVVWTLYSKIVPTAIFWRLRDSFGVISESIFGVLEWAQTQAENQTWTIGGNDLSEGQETFWDHPPASSLACAGDLGITKNPTCSASMEYIGKRFWEVPYFCT